MDGRRLLLCAFAPASASRARASHLRFTLLWRNAGIVLWQGFGDALIALTSQAIGAGNPRLAGVWLQTSVLAITLASLPIGAVWWFTEDILSLAGDSGPGPHVTQLAGQFARWSLIWIMPDAAFSAFCQWLNGQQLVRPTILINVVFVGFNFGANILLVHGALGWDGLGFIGSPIATAITKIMRGCVLVFYICKPVRLAWARRRLACSADNSRHHSPPRGAQSAAPARGLLGPCDRGVLLVLSDLAVSEASPSLRHGWRR